MKFVPAFEPRDGDLFSQITRLLPFFDRFSIDVQDGVVVPSTTSSISEITSYLKENKALFSGVTIDFDLMITDYKGALEAISELVPGITVGNVVVLRSELKSDPFPFLKGLSIGLSINAQDDIETIAQQYNLNQLPAIQLMTVPAGPQGQSFVPDVLNKIQQLRDRDYRKDIYIDGAVNKETVPVIFSQKYLPDFACVGSYLTKSGDELEERVKYLKSVES